MKKNETLSQALKELHTHTVANRCLMDSGILEDIISISNIRIDKIKKKLNYALERSNAFNEERNTKLYKIEITDLVRKTVLSFSNKALEYGMELVIIAEDDIYAFCDPYKVEQVLSSLVSNSINFGDNGPVTITLSTIKEKFVISVHDPGVENFRLDQQLVFNQLNDDIDEEELKTLGTALFVSRRIVKQLEGKITIKSDITEGTTFYVEIPHKLFSP